MISPFLAAVVPGTHFHQIYIRNWCWVTYLLSACCVYFYFSVFQFTAAAGWTFSHLILTSEPHSLALEQPSALIPTVTFMANFAFADSFSEAPNTLLHVQICNLPAWNIIPKWDSPVCKAEEPQAMYELSHKGCHKREPGVSLCMSSFIQIFKPGYTIHSTCTWNISGLRSSLPYRKFFFLFFIDRYLKPHLWIYFGWES